MKHSHREMQEFHERQERQWQHHVHEGPKRWRLLYRVGYPVVGVIFLGIGIAGLIFALGRIMSGHAGQPVGHDARGLVIYPADSVVRNVGIIIASVALMWMGFRRRKRADEGEKH